METQNEHQARAILPIPDQSYPGLQRFALLIEPRTPRCMLFSPRASSQALMCPWRRGSTHCKPLQMARITVRPQWVGILDFEENGSPAR